MKGYHHKEKGIGIVYDDIYLVNGARTPFGKLCGTLGAISPTDLGIYAAKGRAELAEYSFWTINRHDGTAWSYGSNKGY